MRLTRCRLRYRGMQIFSLLQRREIDLNWSVLVLWCSGYHICLTRRRSPVRNRAAPYFFSLLFLAVFPSVASFDNGPRKTAHSFINVLVV